MRSNWKPDINNSLFGSMLKVTHGFGHGKNGLIADMNNDQQVRENVGRAMLQQMQNRGDFKRFCSLFAPDVEFFKYTDEGKAFLKVLDETSWNRWRGRLFMNLCREAGLTINHIRTVDAGWCFHETGKILEIDRFTPSDR